MSKKKKLLSLSEAIASLQISDPDEDTPRLIAETIALAKGIEEDIANLEKQIESGEIDLDEDFNVWELDPKYVAKKKEALILGKPNKKLFSNN